VNHLNETIVVPVTRTIRGLATEVILLPEDGMPVPSALNFDHLALAQRDRLGPVMCILPENRWSDVRDAYWWPVDSLTKPLANVSSVFAVAERERTQ
jgi:mRNA-degrading endonuclease toxin of MazEF toxin-antitoxin module